MICARTDNRQTDTHRVSFYFSNTSGSLARFATRSKGAAPLRSWYNHSCEYHVICARARTIDTHTHTVSQNSFYFSNIDKKNIRGEILRENRIEVGLVAKCQQMSTERLTVGRAGWDIIPNMKYDMKIWKYENMKIYEISYVESCRKKNFFMQRPPTYTQLLSGQSDLAAAK